MYLLIKNLIAAVMILLLISHGIIQFGMFELIQTKHRSEAVNQINKGINKHQQIIFSFEISDYQNRFSHIDWKDEDEFRLNDKMYDIIRTEVRNDSVYFYCLFDSKESDLYSLLDKLIEDASDNSDEENGLNNFFSHFYSLSASYNPLETFQSDNNYFEYIISHPLEGELIVNTPPPRT